MGARRLAARRGLGVRTQPRGQLRAEGLGPGAGCGGREDSLPLEVGDAEEHLDH